MADQDKQFDPINPENKPITDGMERDGDQLRDIRDGKTPTEQAFGIDLGTDEAQDLQDEHEALQNELGQVIAEEEGSPPPVDPITAPLNIETPEVAPESSPGPVQKLHNDLMEEVGAVPQREFRKINAKQRASQKRMNHILRSEHGEKFVEVGNAIEDAQPEPAAPIQGAAKARLKHPGLEKPAAVEEALADNAHEDRLWRSSVVDLFKAQTGFLIQMRLELDALRGQLERSRL